MQQEIHKVLTSNDNSAKIEVLQGLVKKPLSDANPTTLSTLKLLCLDSDPAVRFWARKAYALTQTEDVNSSKIPSDNDEQELPLDTLLKKLADAQSHFVAIEVLEKIFKKKAAISFQPLTNYLKSCKDPVIISYLVKNLGIFFPDETTMAIILPFLKHADERVIANAVEGLESIASPKATVLINQMLSHENHRVRANAAKALASRDPKTTKQVIEFMLNSKDKPHFIIASCHAIKHARLDIFLPDLVKLLHNPLICESALSAIIGIGGESALGYLEAASKNAEKELKEKIDSAIATVRLELSLKNAGETVSNTIEEGKKLGKAIFEKLKDAAGKKIADHSKNLNIGEKISESKEACKAWGKSAFDRAKEATRGNRPGITNFSYGKWAVILAVLIFSTLVFQSVFTSKYTSKQAGTKVLEIVNKNPALLEKIRSIDSSVNTVIEVCKTLKNLASYIDPLIKIHELRYEEKSIYDLALYVQPHQIVLIKSFQEFVEKSIEYYRISLDKIDKIWVISKDLKQPFADLQNGIAALERNEFNWKNTDRITESAQKIIALNDDFKKEVEILKSKLHVFVEVLTDIKNSPVLESLKQYSEILARLVSFAESGVTKIIEGLDALSGRLKSFQDTFVEEVRVLTEICNFSQNIEKIPD